MYSAVIRILLEGRLQCTWILNQTYQSAYGLYDLKHLSAAFVILNLEIVWARNILNYSQEVLKEHEITLYPSVCKT